MTPGSTRALLTLFAITAIGVAINALLLQRDTPATQSARTDGQIAQQRANAERLRRFATGQTPPAERPVDFDTLPAAPPVAPAATQPAKANRARPDAEPAVRAAALAAEPVIRFARFKPDAASTDVLPETPDTEGDAETIRAVQRELIQRGYGPIQADGVPGLVTRAAVMAFEHDNRLALTGAATPGLLKHILLGAAAGAGQGADAGRVRTPEAEHVIRTVQQSLAVIGYQPGRVDGRVGEDTERAIREFELDEGQAGSGRISADLVTRLARATSVGGKAHVKR